MIAEHLVARGGGVLWLGAAGAWRCTALRATDGPMPEIVIADLETCKSLAPEPHRVDVTERPEP